MNVHEQETFSTLTRAQEFIAEKATALGNIPSSTAVTRLNGIVSAANAHEDEKTGGKMTAQMLVQTKAAARRVLVQGHLASIAAAARADLPDTPELAVVRKLPHPNTSVAGVLKRTDEVVKVITPLAQQLIDTGLPSDFIAQLETARHALADSASTHITTLSRKGGATKGIKTQLAAGRRQIRVLDRLIKMQLRGSDQSLLTDWKSRIAAPRRAGTAAKVVTPAPASSQPAAAPAVRAAA
ncbi:MAG: hypothetical protein JWM95_698 [Gemmatimonadetes bacterium]|nr:hypothetical protein [Gemmatimonadota bacterium]